jgi:23S rRNA (adenine2503-C2)-methyltransferase
LKNIFGMTVPEISQVLKEWNIAPYRAKQIAEWMYQRNAVSFEEMTNLPKTLRQKLMENFMFFRAELKARLDSQDGSTTKFLLSFADGIAVETVLMRHSYGNSICVSTQAGCNIGCAFCASTLHGLDRNLTRGEILSQVIFINELLKTEGKKVDTVVIMGSGEPLMNYENVVGFIRLLHEPYCLYMGYRNVTLSTSGIVPEIYALAEENIQITLSISLHAANQDLRTRLMPINNKFPLKDVVAAAKNYGDKTKRRVTYEYILIKDLNDTDDFAAALAGLLRGQLASVNLIPINPVIERDFQRPSQERIDAFEACLTRHHVTVTVRREMGRDIQAACGQLRNKYLVQ